MHRTLGKDWHIRVDLTGKCLLGTYWKREGHCIIVKVFIPFVLVRFSCWGKRWGLSEDPPTFTELVSGTFKKHGNEIRENIRSNNALYRKLIRKTEDD